MPVLDVSICHYYEHVGQSTDEHVGRGTGEHVGRGTGEHVGQGTGEKARKIFFIIIFALKS